MGISICRLYFEYSITNLKNGYIERSTTEIVYGDFLIFLLLQPVGQRGRCGLVDDAQNLQAGNLASILGGLALGVVEIGRHSDYRLFDLAAQVLLRRFLHGLKNHG